MNIPSTIIRAAALKFGTSPEELTLLHAGGVGSDSMVYRYDDKSGAWTLKFKPGDRDAARSNNDKQTFVTYLADVGIPVARPWVSLAGELTELLVNGDNAYIVSSEQMVPGRHVNAHNAAEWNAKYFTAWGALIGQLHKAAVDYPQWQRIQGKPAGETSAIQDWEAEWRSFQDWCREDIIRERWCELYDLLKPLPVERSGYGLIQNDPHPWNILMHGSQLTIIDFEVASFSWFMMDIGVAVYAALEQVHPKVDDYRQYANGFLANFLAGYRQAYPLADSWLERLPLFASYRRILLLIVMYNELVRHPAYYQRLRQAIIDRTPVLPGQTLLRWPIP